MPSSVLAAVRTVWRQADAQTTVGHKRLLRLASPVTSDRVRVRITSARLEPSLAEVGLYKQAEVIAAPLISDRDRQGAVTLACAHGQRILYATGADVVSAQSPEYLGPILLPRGGTVTAACQASGGALGLTASRQFAGLVPTGWAATSSPGGGMSGAGAIDGEAATLWEAKGGSSPHSLTIDMKQSHSVGGFYYLPRRDGKPDGVVEAYRFETSADGQAWTTVVDRGRFDNIRNNPILQEVRFAPVAARYIRFSALEAIDGSSAASAAEVGVYANP